MNAKLSYPLVGQKNAKCGYQPPLSLKENGSRLRKDVFETVQVTKGAM
jgi:hypothetical protein